MNQNLRYTTDEKQMALFAVSFDELSRNFEKWNHVPFQDQVPLERFKSLFFACSICHNITWEFLCDNVIPRIRNATNGFSSTMMKEIDSVTIKQFLVGFDPNRIDSERRALMLRRLSDQIEDKEPDFFETLLKSDTLGGEDGFLVKVNSLAVFGDDPLHKKSNLLAQFALRAGLLKVSDEIELEPAIDYHIIRVYLRTGRLNILDNTTRKLLLNGGSWTGEEITELRQQIRNAMMLFCRKYKRSMAKLCFTDWVIGREYCHRHSPECENSKENCPAWQCCQSCGLPTNSMLLEPTNDSGHY